MFPTYLPPPDRPQLIPTLLALPPELLHEILLYLDIPEFLTLTRVSRPLRTLLLSPPVPLTLFHSRLSVASATLTQYLPARPPLSTLSPPAGTIYMNRTHIIARAISRSLISIRLSRCLTHRPSTHDLVSRSILPQECATGLYASSISPSLIQARRSLTRSTLKDKLGRKLERRPSVNSLVSLNILPEECSPGDGRGAIAPGLVEARRRVVKERLKDGLRAWVERRARVAAAKRKNDLSTEGEDADTPERDAQGRLNVKILIRKFAHRGQGEGRLFVGPSSHNASANSESSVSCACDVHKKLAKRKNWERPLSGPLSQSVIVEQKGSSWGACAQPTRAHVLGLRRFWEGMARAGA